MYTGPGVKTSPDFPVPDKMKAWVLGNPGELKLSEKPVPVPKRAEVLVRIDAVAICATDLEIIEHGSPAMIQGGKPFNKNFTPGHEYMGTVVALGPGVDELPIGQRVTVEIHAGCGQCKRCRAGMYTSCHNYGLNYGDVDKGHRANGFTTDGGFCEYQVNNINTVIAIPDAMSDEEATLVVTAGTAMYGLTELGGLVAGESVVVTGPGPIGLLGVAVAKAMGAQPVILTGTRDNRLQIGRELGLERRRDSFCGKISVCNNLRQYRIPYSLTRDHTVAILDPRFREDLVQFVQTCKVVRGLSRVRIGAVGARPNAFNTTRYSEKLLEASGITVNTIDLSEVFGNAAKISSDDKRVRQRVAAPGPTLHRPPTFLATA